MQRSELLRALQALDIRDLSLDSRQVSAQTAFVAQPAGLAYAADAYARGARVLVCDAAAQPAPDALPADMPVLGLDNLAAQLGMLAHEFYGRPSEALPVFGITGTDGKSSISHYLAQLLSEDLPAEVIGTLGSGPWMQPEPGINTTPDVLSVHRQLAAARSRGAPAVAMEVSSHAIDQGRVDGVHFALRVLSTLGSDHLDYHPSLAAYHETKLSFVRAGPSLIGAELDAGQRASLAGTACLFYGDAEQADYRISDIALTEACSTFRLHHAGQAFAVHSALLARFNVDNLVAALAAAHHAGLPLAQSIARAARLQAVAGRMQRLGGDDLPTVIVDYAHTQQALEKLLLACRAHCRGKLICVFGCGGDRDRSKRPLMAEAVCQHADLVVVTDDNPRNEDPQQIFIDIRAGMQVQVPCHWQHDRAEATKLALSLAQAGDWVVLAGKGHETVQIQQGQTRHYSDAEVAEHLLEQRSCA